METFSMLLAICVGNSLVTREFPGQTAVMRSFDVFFDLCLKEPLSKLEIVDQWSTRIPPPNKRGWQWAMVGLQLNIVQNHKAAFLKAT